MNKKSKLWASSLLALSIALPAAAQAESIPSVVITLENAQPSRGAFLTPPWIGIHDGSFDSYDGGMPASVPLGGNEIEALAEDGNTGPITATFESLLGEEAPQATVPGPGGPLAPGDKTTITLNVDPELDRFFSYVSMIIPSNDFFIANGSPVAHELFDENGNFVGEDFIVSGDETNDAGTEVNDEVASNVAFLNQAAPNTGVDENGVVVTPAPGFAAPGALAYPDGVLNHPVVGNASINLASDRVFAVSFRYVDLGGTVRFDADLSPDQEIQSDVVDANSSGSASLVSRNGTDLMINIQFTNDVTDPLVAAHLHLGQAGTNGPVILDMGSGVLNNKVLFNTDGSDLTGPLDGGSLIDLLNEMAAGNVYINLHSAEFPAGELRGQVGLR